MPPSEVSTAMSIDELLIRFTKEKHIVIKAGAPEFRAAKIATLEGIALRYLYEDALHRLNSGEADMVFIRRLTAKGELRAAELRGE